MYNVRLTPEAANALRKMEEKQQKQIAKKIELLAVNPRRQNTRKLQGAQSLFRFRMGDYRIVYEIVDQELVVIILRIGHRREIYKKLNL